MSLASGLPRGQGGAGGDGAVSGAHQRDDRGDNDHVQRGQEMRGQADTLLSELPVECF